MEDVFKYARGTSTKKFEDKDHGMADFLSTIAEGSDKHLNTEEFTKKVDDMLGQMKPGLVPGFDAADNSHKETLKVIRDIYTNDWALYVISKLMMA
jgi:hypothetical protein